ncbi:MAG: carbohydrate binding family 9 domain-containing protein [Bacteroidales bacterium]|nr:carbohydrate binding family 9 domain-containing protein [Bacteroidales bacterium]
MSIGLLLLSLYGYSQSSENARQKIVIPLTTLTPKIDGRLDEKMWEDAEVIDEFYQYTPHNGAQPTEKTIAYLIYDEKNLYVGFRCYDSEPDKIRASLTQRNLWQNNDYAHIYLDTYDNKRDNFLFMINPLGVQKNSFETIWRSAGIIDSLGWSGEIAIPFKSLRFPDQDIQTWGIVIGRNIQHKGEMVNSIDCRYDEDYNSKFMEASGMTNISEGHNLEILPYGAFRYSNGESFSESDGAVGLDVKLGLASNMVLEGSLAPDFSQVESDPFFVNFSPYEYQLAENRPFFNEGASYFTQANPLFYSRRIESPKAMTKLTGKEGPWNIGALAAWDAPLSGEEKLIHALRFQRDVLKTSRIGMMMSGFETMGTDYNRNVSVDGQFSNGYEQHFQFQLASSFNSNCSNSENSLVFLNYRIQKIEGVNYSFNYLDIGPNYNPRTGIVGQAGYRNPQLMLGYRWHLPEWGIESILMSAVGNYSHAYVGLPVKQSADASISVSTINKFNAGIKVSIGEERSQLLIDDQYTWNEKMYPGNSFSMNIASSTGSVIDGSISYIESKRGLYVNNFTGQQEGVNKSLNLGITLKPASNILIKNSSGFYQQRLDGDQNTLYEAWLFHNSFHYQITPHVFSKIILQYNTLNKTNQNDFLIGYEFFAGSTLYLSYKELRQYYDKALSRENYMVYFKMSYLFRI